MKKRSRLMSQGIVDDKAKGEDGDIDSTISDHLIGTTNAPLPRFFYDRPGTATAPAPLPHNETIDGKTIIGVKILDDPLSTSDAPLAQNKVVDEEPYVGMQFEDDEGAFKFYSSYARKVGFGVKKLPMGKSPTSGVVEKREFCCPRRMEGFYSPELGRCEAHMSCKLVKGKFTVVSFVKEHNHNLFPVQLLRAQAEASLMGSGEGIRRMDQMQGNSGSNNTMNMVNNPVQRASPVQNVVMNNLTMNNNHNPMLQAQGNHGSNNLIYLNNNATHTQHGNYGSNNLMNKNNNRKKQLEALMIRQRNLMSQGQTNLGINPTTLQASAASDTFLNQRNYVRQVEKRANLSFETLSWEPRAFLFQDFLSKEECEHLIQLAQPHLKRSVLTDRLTGNGIVSSARTSSGASLKRGNDQIVTNIEKRIAEASFLPLEHGEPLHVLRYEVGQKIEPHYDAYDNSYDHAKQNGGQRIATFLMYLSDVEEGGETIFPRAKGKITTVPWCDGSSQNFKSGVVVKPKLGNALLFWHIKPDGTLDPDSLHCGSPVVKGKKWCCQKMIRAGVFDVTKPVGVLKNV